MIKGTRKLTAETLVEYIANYIESTGWPPSRREIAEHFGVGLGTTQQAIGDAVEAGLIEIPEHRPPGGARSLVVTGAGMKHAQHRHTQF